MVGTPESAVFFEQAIQLARRSLGLKYGAIAFDGYFQNFCKTLLSYYYVSKMPERKDALIEWLYSHSGGILSVVVSLVHDAQEIAILNGRERLDIEALTEAY